MLIPFVLELIVNVKIKAKQVAITLLSPCQASSKNQKVDNRVWSVDCNCTAIAMQYGEWMEHAQLHWITF